MRAGIWTLILLPIFAGAACAEAPLVSIRPMPRPPISTPVEPAAQPVPTDRPRSRPASPDETSSLVTAAANATKPSTSRKGSVCNNANIKGVALKPIKSRVKGCNVKAPVSVTAVDGVRLVPPATINCEAAQALAVWVDQGLQPAFGNQVVQLNVVDSYSCRPRNNVRGAKISEHGAGNAIDISGFVLRSGKTLSVARNYGSEIKKAKKAACGTFHTTLGPGSDGYHEDHVHLDVSHRRGSPYCH